MFVIQPPVIFSIFTHHLIRIFTLEVLETAFWFQQHNRKVELKERSYQSVKALMLRKDGRQREQLRLQMEHEIALLSLSLSLSLNRSVISVPAYVRRGHTYSLHPARQTRR